MIKNQEPKKEIVVEENLACFMLLYLKNKGSLEEEQGKKIDTYGQSWCLKNLGLTYPFQKINKPKILKENKQSWKKRKRSHFVSQDSQDKEGRYINPSLIKKKR